MTRTYVRLRLADVEAVMDTLGLSGARLDHARFQYLQRDLPCDPEIRAEVDASYQHMQNARLRLHQLLRDAGA